MRPFYASPVVRRSSQNFPQQKLRISTLQLHKRTGMRPVSGLKSRRIVEVLLLAGGVCETHLGFDSPNVPHGERGEQLGRRFAWKNGPH